MATTALPHWLPPKPDALRDQLIAMVINDLLGPAGGEEELNKDEWGRERYLVGLCECMLPGVTFARIPSWAPGRRTPPP